MRSAARRCGAYDGEYSPTGLRLFAWWKKNGERRLQKPGSGSAQIRSNQTGGSLILFIADRNLHKELGRASYANQNSAARLKTNRSHRS
jgi:hypothetical protein